MCALARDACTRRLCQRANNSKVCDTAYYTLKNAKVVTDQQTSCNTVVVKPISGCVRTACSAFASDVVRCNWVCRNKLLICYHVVNKVDDGNRLHVNIKKLVISNLCSFWKLPVNNYWGHILTWAWLPQVSSPKLIRRYDIFCVCWCYVLICRWRNMMFLMLHSE